MPIAKHALVATVVILYAPPGAQAQLERPSMPPETVEWSAARKLTRGDFKGDVPNTAKYQSRSWIRIEASWRCISDTLNTTINAVFDPARSWWLGSQWNPWEDVDSRRKWLSRSRADFENTRHIALSEADLLRHEQVHFDLAALTAGKIRRRLADLQGPCALPDRDAVVEKIVVDLTDEFGQEQTHYDDETAHGTKPQVQEQWEKRVERGFQASPTPHGPR
jgi:hypothetical protein